MSTNASVVTCAPSREVVSLLQERGVDVYLVSGGFLSLIAPVALRLGIPLENVYANRIQFFYDGEETFCRAVAVCFF